MVINNKSEKIVKEICRVSQKIKCFFSLCLRIFKSNMSALNPHTNNKPRHIKFTILLNVLMFNVCIMITKRIVLWLPEKVPE